VHYFDINSSGVVVGSVRDQEKFRAAVWDAANGLQYLFPDTELGSFASGINSSGQIVGFYYSGNDARDHVFVWDRVNGLRDLHNEISLGGPTYAAGINDAGQIAGWLTVPAPDGSNWPQRAFLWDPVTGVQYLPEEADRYSYDLNSSAQVVGLGYLWDRDLGVQPVHLARDINDAGQMAGGMWNDDETFTAHIWVDPMNSRDLGDFSGGKTESDAYSINSQGQVVGYGSLEVEWNGLPGNRVRHAAIWDENGMHDLTDMLETPLPVLTQTRALAINDVGQIIMEIDDATNVLLTPIPGMKGDFDGSGILDLPDVDQLTRQSANKLNPLRYDLNNDKLINTDDVTVWARDLFHTWIGDANLDEQFDSSDLVSVLASGTYEADINSGWSTGDFNGDGRTNSSDLVLALADGGYEMGPRAAVATIPEPGSWSRFLLAVAIVCTMRSARTLHLCESRFQ
jgi:uncharacterized membrane protein